MQKIKFNASTHLQNSLENGQKCLFMCEAFRITDFKSFHRFKKNHPTINKHVCSDGHQPQHDWQLEFFVRRIGPTPERLVPSNVDRLGTVDVAEFIGSVVRRSVATTTKEKEANKIKVNICLFDVDTKKCFFKLFFVGKQQQRLN